MVWLLFGLAVSHAAGVVAMGGDGCRVAVARTGSVLLAVAGTAARTGLFAATGPVKGVRRNHGHARREPLVRRRTVPVVAFLGLCGLSLGVTLGHPRASSAMHDWRVPPISSPRSSSWLDETLPAGTVISSHNMGTIGRAGPSLVVVMFGRTDGHVASEGEPDCGWARAASTSTFAISTTSSTSSPVVAVEARATPRDSEIEYNPVYASLSQRWRVSGP